MLRFGIVTDIDAAKGKARVTFEEDGIVSDWLPIAVPKAMGDSFSWMLEVNEQVACLMDEYAEKGVIIGAIYSNAVQPNGGNKNKYRVRFSDGTVIEYDKAEGKLLADVKGDVEVKATGSVSVEAAGDVDVETATTATVKAVQVTLDAPNVIVTGILTVAQLATAAGSGGNGNVSIEGNLNITDGDLTVTNGDVQADTVSLKTHIHTGVAPSTGLSGPPQP